MKQEIVCMNCTGELKSLFPTANPFPGETVKFVSGDALRPFMCDHCGGPIDQDGRCTAFSIAADYGAPYYEWEHEYIKEACP